MARKLIVEIIGDATSFERSLKQSQAKATGFQKGISKLKFAAFGAAAGGAVLLGKGLKGAAEKALESEKAQTRLKSAMKNAGVSQQKYGKQIDATIAKTSKLSGLDDEELSDSFAKLLRTTGSVEEATRGMALAADISRARNIDLAKSTNIVEKAHVGQLKGLKGVGVETYKNMDVLEALELANKKFAGSAEEYGKTAAGAQDRLGVAFENLQEKVGEKLLPVLQRLALKLIDLIEWGEENWPKFQAAVDKAFDKIGPTIETVIKVIRGFVDIIHGILTGDWSLVWKGFKAVVVNETKLLFTYLSTVGGLLLKAGKALGLALLNGIKDGLVGLAKLMLRLVVAPINAIIDAINAIKLPSKGVTIAGKRIATPALDPIPNIPRINIGGATVVHTTVTLDGKVVAQSTTKQQQKSGQRNPPQKRGIGSLQAQPQ